MSCLTLRMIAALMTVTGASGAVPGGTVTQAVPADVRGPVEYVPGRYGLGVRTLSADGITYPCGLDTFDPQHGTFAFWVKAPAYHCVWAFRLENEAHLRLGLWHDRARTGEAGPAGYRFFPFPFYGNDGVGFDSAMLQDLWYHVAMTWDMRDPMARGTVRVWLNGAGMPRPLRPMPPFARNPGTFFAIGLFPGVFDDVVILDRALDQEGIQRLFFGGPFRPDEHTRLYVSFDGTHCDGIGVRKTP